MKTKSAPTSAPEQPVPLASYIAQFEHWMRTSPRCGKGKAEDVCQEIRLALWELRDLPVTREEARRVFMRMASRFESRVKRQVFRQGALLHDVDEFAEQVRCFNEQLERDTIRALALFNALEKLSDEERWLVKECKIEERNYAEVARQIGVTDNTVRNRLWRAMTKLMAFFKEEKRREEQEKNQRENDDEDSAAIVAPLAFEFTETQRAAFSAIWRAEGRVPTFGGGPPEPPGPPVIPSVPPIAAAPVVSAAVGSAVSAVTIAIVVVLLILVPTGIVAIYYFWDPPLAQTANKGLRAPPVSVVEDVVPMNYVPPPRRNTALPAAATSSIVQVPTPPTSSSSAPVRSADASSSSPPVDPKELERARRHRGPRFLPSP